MNDFLGCATLDLKTITIDKLHTQWIKLKDMVT